MSPRRTAPSAPGSRRRWHIPPPLLHGSEALEGGEILNEAAGEAALLLWQTMRDVRLWAQAPAEERRLLFAAGAAERRLRFVAAADLDDEIRPTLERLARLLDGGSSAEEVADACSKLAEWAQRAARPATALAFAQDAALAAPTSPLAAYEAGRIARSMADHARAEVWFRRAIALARQARDWRLYSRAFSGLGNLYVLRANYPAARRLHIRALRGARRGGMRAEQAAALHDLFRVEVTTGRLREAERYAEMALQAYGQKNPRVSALARDVAYSWMEQGCFERALPVFESVLPLVERPAERLLVQSNIARAAAGAGERNRFHEIAEDLLERLQERRFSDAEGRALTEIAQGAAFLNDWEMVERAANRALQVATGRSEGEIRVVAEALLDSASHRRLADGLAARERTRGVDQERSDELARALVTTLRSLAGAPA